MIDDIAAISECGDNSIVLNSIINAKIETKKLQFNLKKSLNMHVGDNKRKCKSLNIHDEEMSTTTEQKYLGDLVSSTGTNNANIKDRCNSGYNAISQIKSMMVEISLGKFCIS